MHMHLIHRAVCQSSAFSMTLSTPLKYNVGQHLPAGSSSSSVCVLDALLEAPVFAACVPAHGYTCITGQPFCQFLPASNLSISLRMPSTLQLVHPSGQAGSHSAATWCRTAAACGPGGGSAIRMPASCAPSAACHVAFATLRIGQHACVPVLAACAPPI